MGYTTIEFANKYPDANIIAIEPDSNNYALLCENSSDYPHVHTFRGALWTTNGHLAVDRSEGLSWAIRVREVSALDANAVEGITISQLLSQQGADEIDLLKLDIE